jgi:cytidylate kinase
MIVAIDGPAAAGKGTIARKLAAEFGYAHLDTGALYRAVALRVRDSDTDPDDEAAVVIFAANPGSLEDPRLRDDQTATLAARISALPGVRAALLDYQRDFANNPPGGAKGAVLEGRDIGTIVCPDAERKIFLDASAEIRAGRRMRELRARGDSVSESAVLRDLKARDALDRNRPISPLVPAADAYLIETSNLDIDSAFEVAKAFVLSGKIPPTPDFREEAG